MIHCDSFSDSFYSHADINTKKNVLNSNSLLGFHDLFNCVCNDVQRFDFLKSLPWYVLLNNKNAIVFSISLFQVRTNILRTKNTQILPILSKLLPVIHCDSFRDSFCSHADINTKKNVLNSNSFLGFQDLFNCVCNDVQGFDFLKSLPWYVLLNFLII